MGKAIHSTIRIGIKTATRLREIAKREGRTIVDVSEDAVTAYETLTILKQMEEQNISNKELNELILKTFQSKSRREKAEFMYRLFGCDESIEILSKEEKR